jgi:D-glycero-D-manno-heptose 1,7-bisphosphate phosphatase
MPNPAPTPPRPAVFLDRDDTLIACNELPPPPSPGKPGDLIDPNLVRLLPGVHRGLRALRQAGFTLVVISNQGAVARGAATTDTVDAVNRRVAQLLDADDGNPPLVPIIEKWYYCPFHPSGNVPRYTREHPWRKPNPGMIRAAASDLNLDLRRSWLIGDADRDLQAGRSAGLAPDRCLLVGPIATFRDFAAATNHILASLS